MENMLVTRISKLFEDIDILRNIANILNKSGPGIEARTKGNSVVANRYSMRDMVFLIDITYSSDELYIRYFDMGQLRGRGYGRKLAESIFSQLPNNTKITGKDITKNQNEKSFWEKISLKFPNLNWYLD